MATNNLNLDGGEISIIKALGRSGSEISGEQLKTAPRGYPKDHPRITLLRHKQLFAGRSYGFEEHIHTAALVQRVRADWAALRPLLTWLATATDSVDDPGP